MRREDFPLRTLHVLVFIKEEYEDFTTTYLAKNKDESLERMIRRIVHRRGSLFGAPQSQYFLHATLRQSSVNLQVISVPRYKQRMIGGSFLILTKQRSTMTTGLLASSTSVVLRRE
ncbi:hypothetical protein PHMEG_00025695 [Phytophthora megakarya]|uniref:Uncharacterized protein n=1 Tax=Phytophthora megakarya TaxID=4795 RepID=A0A225VB20_9STRA|nr:hypothetical protein PHMEG_00025695 [Phytophthora megakarya]